MRPIFAFPEQDHADNLWTYYAILNSRLTRLHADEAGQHNNPQITTYTEPALSSQGAL